MKYYGYEEFFVDVNKIAHEVKSYKPDAILAIARGGLTFGHFLAHALDLRELYVLNSIHYEESKKLDYIKVFNVPNIMDAKRVLVVDDIVDSGETMVEIQRVINEKFPNIEYKTASLFYKTNALLIPDFSAKEAKEWIEFFWDFKI